ncbi:hypothetical protein ACOQFV_09120 [Nocardiopsis changdeensis]|uniref:DUF2746 domain-containing protein n=1 Tax=Nocardiopsis changdeensis TaxID=2831969 RepID=A0ABX8BDH5_9ACTN|nr:MULTISPECIES: hypothetical protein [Nocardiopsis]QUX20297.1 hypothetical protein KGD84_17360 [Nocardiopsis changdeensis]QYX36227.1 hypothetical protein K1J57_26815 [Nocardiopsis sp. MT53]
MMGLDGVVIGGAGASLLGAVAWAISLLFRAAQTRSDAGTATVTDAAAANAALVSSLNGLQQENERLRARVSSLEDELSQRDERIDALEARIREMESRLHDEQTRLRRMADELAELRQR